MTKPKQTVPKWTSELHYQIYKQFEKSPGAQIPVSTIIENVDDDLQSYARTALSNLKTNNRVERVNIKAPNGQQIPMVKLTGYGKNIVAALDNIEIKPFAPGSTGRGPDGSTKAKAKAKAKVKAVNGSAVAHGIAAPQPVLLSTSADALADQIAAVLKENSDYRAEILQSCERWAKFLGLKLVPINDDSTDNDN